MIRFKRNIWWFLTYGVLLFLAFNRHSHDTGFNYHSEMWSDKSGYYVYLPATFIYQFDAERLPNKIDSLTGTGFLVKDGKIRTKYPLGVAICQAPFFLMAHAIATIAPSYENNGFSVPYKKMILVSAVTYCVLAIQLLWPWLLSFSGSRWAAGGLALILLGTNLLYYVVFESGLSHVYSFFLFSLLIYLLYKRVSLDWLLLVLSLSLSVRYTNILCIIPLYFMRPANYRFQLSPFSFIPLILAVVPHALQLVYNQYVYDSISLDSYHNEGFVYWWKPRIATVWFAPNNGLFLYTPFWLILLFAQFKQFKNPLSKGSIAVFALITLLYASWWAPELGCAFGHRGFTEYLPFFLPGFLSLVRTYGPLKKTLLTGAAILCSLYTLKLMFSYDYCYYGSHHWDWSFYIELLSAQLK